MRLALRGGVDLHWHLGIFSDSFCTVIEEGFCKCCYCSRDCNGRLSDRIFGSVKLDQSTATSAWLYIPLVYEKQIVQTQTMQAATNTTKCSTG